MSPPRFVERHASALRAVSLVALVVALLVATRAMPIAPWVASLEAWIDGLGAAGVAAFIAIYVAAAVLFVPGSLLTAAAGALFGLAGGTAVVSVASTTAAAIAFLIARHLARAAVERKAASNVRFRAIDRAIERGGWRVIALLRLSPAVPFSLGNYLFGLTAIRFWPYVLASWIAMLPGTFLFVYLGKVARDGLAGAGNGRSAGQWSLLVAGLVATVATVVYVTRLARRALRDSTAIEESKALPSAAPKGGAWVALGTAAVALLACIAAGVAWLRREDLRRWAESHAPAAQRSGGADGR